MLAAGVAATAVLFAVVDAVYLRPLPYPDAGRLVTLFGTFASEGPDGRHSLSWQEVREISARSTTL